METYFRNHEMHVFISKFLQVALNYLNKGLKKDPQCIDILELKGRCFVNMNQHE